MRRPRRPGDLRFKMESGAELTAEEQARVEEIKAELDKLMASEAGDAVADDEKEM
jgi:hypothetical protein